MASRRGSLFSFSPPASSAPVEIRGQLRFAQGAAPAENIIVRLESFSGGSINEIRTDRSGKFYFPGLVPDQYNVVIRAFGYKEIQRPVDLQTVTSDYVFVQLVADTSVNAATTSQPTVSSVDANVAAEAGKEFEKGRTAMQSKKVSEGLTHLQSAVTIYPKFIEAQILLGAAYIDLRQWDKAEEALRRAVQINDKATTAMFALGEVLRREKKYDEAEKVVNEVLKLDGKSAPGHYTLGEIYRDKNDIPNAGKQIGTALQLKPDFAEAHLLAGNILLRAPRRGVADGISRVSASRVQRRVCRTGTPDFPKDQRRDEREKEVA